MFVKHSKSAVLIAMASLFTLLGVVWACQPHPGPAVAPTKALLPTVHTQTTSNGQLVWVELPPGAVLNLGVAKPLATIQSLAKAHHAQVVINGGFFDPANGQTTSEVTLAGGQRYMPEDNPRLMQNESLKPYLPQVFNRSELRQYDCKQGATNAIHYAIVRRNSPLLDGCTLNWRLGAGPQLVPAFTHVEEAFWATDASGKVIRNPIGLNGRAARSAVALFPDGRLWLVLGARLPNDATSGWTLEALANALNAKGASQVLALDGGSSSSLWANNHWYPGMWNANNHPVQRKIYSYLWVQ